MDESKRERQYSWRSRIVFISNIPFFLKAQDVLVVMRQFGRCFRVDLARGENGKSKGFAFCEFENQEDARTAVEYLDSAKLEGRPLRAEISDSPPDDLISM